MADGNEPNPNLFSLLPSDLANIKDAAKYANERKEELVKLSKTVKEMGFLQCFWDSQVALKNRGCLNISFSFSDPEELEKEIKKGLNFLNYMLQVTDKVDDELKTEDEKAMPYLIVINLNAELSNLFEEAHLKKGTSTSKIIAKMYGQFIDRRPEIENKMRKIENIFLKQQCLAECRRHEKLKEDIQRASREVETYREKEMNDLQGEVDHLREENKNLQEGLKRNERMIEYLINRMDEFRLN